MSAENRTQKEEALRQISQIKNHLVDKESFFPYNYNATYVWSLIAVVLTFVMVPMYEKGIVMGTVLLFVLIVIGFVAEGMMTKKVNESYDIEDCTLRQQFIMRNFIMLSMFLIIMSTSLAMLELYLLIYLMWLFLISFGYYVVGYVLNIRRFSKMAQFNVLMSLVLLSLATYNDVLVGSDSVCFLLVQAAVIIGLAIFPAIIAWYQKKEM